MMKSVIREAFILGFLVSREGFNGECTYGHCAPRNTEPYHEESREFALGTPEFMKLVEEAVVRLWGSIPESL